jgi:hypothetical protein
MPTFLRPFVTFRQTRSPDREGFYRRARRGALRDPKNSHFASTIYSLISFKSARYVIVKYLLVGFYVSYWICGAPDDIILQQTISGDIKRNPDGTDNDLAR